MIWLAVEIVAQGSITVVFAVRDGQIRGHREIAAEVARIAGAAVNCC